LSKAVVSKGGIESSEDGHGSVAIGLISNVFNAFTEGIVLEDGSKWALITSSDGVKGGQVPSGEFKFESIDLHNVSLSAVAVSSSLTSLDHGLREWSIHVLGVGTESSGGIEGRARGAVHNIRQLFVGLGGLAALDVRCTIALARDRGGGAGRGENALAIVGGRDGAFVSDATLDAGASRAETRVG